MTRQVTDNLYIELDYFTPEEYYTYEAVAASAQSTEFTVACDAELIAGGVVEFDASFNSEGATTVTVTKIVNGVAEFTSAFTQTATISHIEGADLFAFTEASIAVQIDRIRDNNISTSSTFNIATDYVRFRTADSEVDSIVSAIIDGLRSRNFNLETQAAFSFNTTSNLLKAFDSNLSAEFNVSIDVDITKTVDILLESQSTLTSLVDRFRNQSADVSSEFTISIDVIRIKQINAVLSNNAELGCVISHIHGADIIVNGFAELTAELSSLTKETSVLLNSTSTMSVSGGFTFEYSAALKSHCSVYIGRNAYHNRPIQLNVNYTVSDTRSKFGASSVTLFNYTQVLRTLSYPIDIRITNTDSFVVEGWYWGTTIGDGDLGNSGGFLPIMYLGSGLNISSTGVGDNQWVLGLLRTQNPSGFLGTVVYRLLWRNSSNQTEIFDSISYGNAGPAIPNFNAQWTHYAVTRDSNQTVRFLVNGNTLITGSAPTTRAATQYRLGFTAQLGTTGAEDRAYWDEISYRKGTSNISLGPISDDPNTQVFLFHFDTPGFNNEVDDTSGSKNIVQTASSNITSTASVNGKISGPVKYSATLSSSSSITATISHIEGADLFAFGNATLTASVEKIKESASDISAQVSQSVDVNVTRSFVLDVQSTAEVSATALRTKQLSSNLTTEAFTVTVAFETQDFIADLSSEFVTNAAVNYIPFIDAALAITSTLSASIRTDVFVAMTISSSAAVIAEVVKTTDVTVLQVNESTLNAQAVKTTDIVLNQVSEFTVVCNGVTSSEINLVAFSNANVSATISPIRSTGVAVNSQFTFVVNTADSLNKLGNANLSNQFTVSVFAKSIVNFNIATETATSSLTANVSVIRNAQSAFTSSIALASTIVKQINTSAEIISSSLIVAIIGKRKEFNSSIASALTFVVAIRDLRLDEIVYVIPGENYVYQIISESRLHGIYGETRIRSITGESRNRTITGESRIHIID